MTYEELKRVVDPLCCRWADAITTPELPLGSFDLLTFPMTELNEADGNPTVHYFEVVRNHAGDVDFFNLASAYKAACAKKDLQLLPPPFGLKAHVPRDTKLQFVILTCNDGSLTILKHLCFPEKVKPSFLRTLLHGEPHKAMYMNINPKIGRKIIQYCLENMGGRMFKCAELTAQAAVKKAPVIVRFEDKEDAEIDAGFDYIMQHGPRSASENQQLRWQTKALRNTESPIYGWPIGLVDKALRNLSSDGALARKETQWPIPLTHRFYHPWVLEILESIWDFDQSALIMLGEAGVGKSPLGRSVLMAQARWNKSHFQIEAEPCIRCTPEIDFLRGEQGSKVMGDFLDDTSLNNLTMKMVKAFLDVGLYESMCWARWGATKWVQNEPRAVADNAYDAAVDMPEDFLPHIPFKAFFETCRPAFIENATPAHMDAVFKRACFLVNTKTHIFYRKAGINNDPVPRVPIQQGEYLTRAGKVVYGLFKEDGNAFPDNFLDEVRREQEWVAAIMQKREKERKEDKQKEKERLQIRAALFGDKPKPAQSVTQEIANKHNTLAQVKREREHETQQATFKKAKAWSRALAGSAVCIDLEDSGDEGKKANPPTQTADDTITDIAHLAWEEGAMDAEEDFEEDVFGFGTGLEQGEDD